VAKGFRLLASVLPAGVVANSASTLSFLGLNRRKLTVVAYSGVDEAVLDRSVVRLFNGDSPVVLLIGRIAEWKGQHIFIAAAQTVIQRFPDAIFQIVGSPLFGEEDYEQSLRELVRELGVEHSVQFLGFRSDIVELIEHSDIVVHTSCIGEPFGQVVVQGMAASKPVIATLGGAIPEIVIPGVTGLLTQMGNSDALADAIFTLLRDPASAVQMGIEGKERVRRKFTITHTVNAVVGLYDRINDKAALGRRSGSNLIEN
jgi:glycosyltransferase involved in cell wall biosynthesis